MPPEPDEAEFAPGPLEPKLVPLDPVVEVALEPLIELLLEPITGALGAIAVLLGTVPRLVVSVPNGLTPGTAVLVTGRRGPGDLRTTLLGS